MRVRCNGLTVEYSTGGHAVRAVEALDMEVGTGELGLLLGASGCGKTTLLSALAAILTPTAGTIHVGEQEVTGLRGRALAEYRQRTVGIVFQAFNLIPSLNATENVQVPLRAAGLGRLAAGTRADELLADFGLAERRKHRPRDLSGGQQQRVALARALALDPPLLLADEPTAHLDSAQVEEVARLLRQIADDGRTVIVSTHDERLTPLADRVHDMTPAGSGALHLSKEVGLEPGEILFRQGDGGELVYVIKEGEIEIVRELEDGREEVVKRFGGGQYFGELAPILKAPRSATARATVRSHVSGMSLPEFRLHMKAEHGR
jgi:putative ABC transport system ATP-binding protein